MDERTDERPVLSWAILISLGLGVLLAMVGGILDLFSIMFAAGAIAGVGIVLITAALVMGHWMRLMPMIRPRATQKGRPQEIRQWQILKGIAILLNLMAVLSLAVLVFAVMVRMGDLRYQSSAALVLHVPNLLAMSLLLVSSAGFVQSMRTPLKEDRTPLSLVMHYTAVSGALLAAAWGALVATGIIGDASRLAPQDHAMMFLAAGLFIALDLFVDRPLPTVYVLLSEERDVYSGHSHFKQSKSIIAPTLGAFALLFLVFLMFVAFSGGLTGLWTRVTSDLAYVIVLAVIVVALGGSAAGAIILAKSPDEIVLFKKKADAADVMARNLLIGSLVGAAGFGLLALVMHQGADILGMNRARWTDMLALGVLSAVGPYGFYAAHKAHRVRQMEERFPDFLRDLAGSHRGGLTLPAAVSIAARGDYGPLSPEVQRMADQMSWNVSFREALQRFGERVKTPLVERAVNLILEADRSGGSTSDVLLAAARDARQIKGLENERSLSMALYTMVIYITFGVFLLVAAVLYGQFIPEIVGASEALSTGGLSGGANQIDTATLPQYRAFYHIAAVSQATGSGIIAGMMGTGKAVLGLRHSFIMVSLAAILFGVFLW